MYTNIKETLLTADISSFRKESLLKKLYYLLGSNVLLKTLCIIAPLYRLKVTGIANGNYKISTLPSKTIELIKKAV